MRKLGAMQFGCCFTRFQLGALSHTPYVGKDAGKGELHLRASGSFGQILNDL